MDGDIVQVDDDGRVIYRASAIGGCVKALAAVRMGYDTKPPPQQMLEVFARGHESEDRAINLLMLRGYEITSKQREVELPITDMISVVGHIDGLIDYESSVVEIKSQSQDEWDSFNQRGFEARLFPKYRWQFSVYRHALQMPLILVRYNRATAELDIQTVDDSLLYSVDEIGQRVTQIESIAATMVLPDECPMDYPCPVYYLHPEDEREQLGEEVDALIRQYRAGQKMERLGKQKREDAKMLLREAVEGLKGQTPNGAKVTFFKKTRKVAIVNPNDPFQLLAEWEEMKITGDEQA